MMQTIKRFWLNLSVGILGLIVGFVNLLRWFDNNSLTKELIIGITCLSLGSVWIIYVLVKNKNDKKSNS